MFITEIASGSTAKFQIPVAMQVSGATVNGSPVTVSSYNNLTGEVTLASMPAANAVVTIDYEPVGNGRDYTIRRTGLNQASGNVDFVVPLDECTDHQISVEVTGSITAGSVALQGIPLGKTAYEVIDNMNATPAAISFTLSAAVKKARFTGRYTSFRLVPTGITGTGSYSVAFTGWSQGNAY